MHRKRDPYIESPVTTRAAESEQSSEYSRVQSGRWGGATRVAPPTPNSIGLYGKSYLCKPEHVHSFDLDILQKNYVRTLESYAYFKYYLFSNHGHFCQMKLFVYK